MRFVSVLLLGLLPRLASGQTPEGLHLLQIEAAGARPAGVADRAASPAAPGPATPAEPTASPWDQLPAEVRDDLQRVLKNQLAHPGRLEDGSPASVAAGYNSSAAHAAWKALGLADDTWPRHFFDRGLDAEGRRMLLALHAKMRADGVWSELETFAAFDPASTWAGFRGMPRHGMDAFRARLGALGFGDWFFASRPPRWGVRSARRGLQLHIIGPPPGGDPRFCEIHVDFENPGEDGFVAREAAANPFVPPVVPAVRWIHRGLKHRIVDLERATNEDIVDRVFDGVRSQGIAIPEVDLESVGALRVSGFLKWELGPDGRDGYLWMKPAAREAGWWTRAEGARSFERVERAGNEQAAAGAATFRLHGATGLVDVTIRADGSVSTRWPEARGRPARSIAGRLIEGRVRTP